LWYTREMRTEPTFQATIYVGLTAKYAGEKFLLTELVQELRSYTDAVGFCVSVTPVRFVYKDGDERGAAIGVINYPRFPESADALMEKTLGIARRLGSRFKQFRVSVVTPAETMMLEEGIDY
jgi:hypothetical protein